MIVVTGYDEHYEIAVARARYALGLGRLDRDRLLERIAAKYPQAVAAALDDMCLPQPTVQPGYDNDALIVPVGSPA